MAQENVEVVRRVYEAWARGEFPGPAELLDPKIEYVNPAGAVEPGTRHGLDAFAQTVEKVFEGWATWQGGGVESACGPFAMGRWCGTRGFMGPPTPSKPRGCGSSRAARERGLLAIYPYRYP